MVDDLSLIIGGSKFLGWESIRVTRSIERFPSDFEITMTERHPWEMPHTRMPLPVVPGDACKIALGDDLVLTGYVDCFRPNISTTGHTIQVVGRNKCCDLIDASAEWPNGQLSQGSVYSIAKLLASPFGIDVEGGVEDDTALPQVNLNYGETPYQVIERLSRFRGLLIYDTPEGNLRLSRAAFLEASSIIKEGENVQAASIDYRMDGRYSEYVVQQQSVSLLKEESDAPFWAAKAEDPGVRRHRRLYIIDEGASSTIENAKRRADWEYRRRAGRSAQLNVVVDSWRDGNGNLWEPNTLVSLYLPSMKLVDKSWLIADVTYRRDNTSGTTCELRLMPPEAFLVQPPNQPQFADVRQAMAGTPLGDAVLGQDSNADPVRVEDLPPELRNLLKA